MGDGASWLECKTVCGSAVLPSIQAVTGSFAEDLTPGGPAHRTKCRCGVPRPTRSGNRPETAVRGGARGTSMTLRNRTIALWASISDKRPGLTPGLVLDAPFRPQSDLCRVTPTIAIFQRAVIHSMRQIISY